MTERTVLARLRAAQRRLCALAEDLDDADLRRQFHAHLSPLGWHLGHCDFIENYWLREVVQRDDRPTRHLDCLYFPQNSHKPERGAALPHRDELLEGVRAHQRENLKLLGNGSLREHPLLEADYLALFLVQHHGLHVETMRMIRTQMALRTHASDAAASVKGLESRALDARFRHVAGGDYRVGGEPPAAFDNELPAQRVACEAFRIGARPVTNAEYLRFMEAGGYRARRHWSESGWKWLQQAQCERPDHWRQDRAGAWYGVDLDGAHALEADAPVHGIGYFEACAFAHWAGARLPHEYEWEIANRAECMEDTGQVWEWCDNAFHPYPGFRAFPYDEYSRPWFDGEHIALRGASRHTPRDLQRPSFRNFYTPDKRHIFAGLRLAY